MRENVFEKVENFVELVSKSLPRITEHQVKFAVGRISNNYFYNVNKKYKPSKIELKVHEALIRKGYTASQVYKWFLLLDADKDIKDMLEHNKISIKNAIKVMSERNQQQCRDTMGARILKNMIMSVFELHIDPRIGTPNKGDGNGKKANRE